jgi:glycosyltransferase involved in cell wall biosynthesis
MDYPKAFRQYTGPISRVAVAVGRQIADVLNIILPGKRRARVVLVANQRTRDALPTGLTGSIIELVENGVDLAVWQRTAKPSKDGSAIRFVFVGRLVDWKALDVVLEALCRLKAEYHVKLDIIGDGEMRRQWEGLAEELGVSSIVRFLGFMSQSECAAQLIEADVFVLPSVFECGGAVVLEAMAMGLPVIATAWGGPMDYLNEECGILVDPVSRDALVEGFFAAMKLLAISPDLRRRMGEAGFRRAVSSFDWTKKTDQMLEIYALASSSKTAAAVALDELKGVK